MTQRVSSLTVATFLSAYGLHLQSGGGGGVIAATTVAKKTGEDTDSKSDLDMDHAYLFLINRISYKILYIRGY